MACGLVGGLVCGLVDGPVCGPVCAVCGPSKYVLLLLGYRSQRACGLLFPSSSQLGSQPTKEPVCDCSCRGFRVSHGPVRCCGGVAVLLRCCSGAVAVLLRCCCSVAVLLRWCCVSVAVVRPVVPVDGPVGGPVGCPVIDLVSEAVGDLVGGMVQSVVRSVRSVVPVCPDDGPVVRSVVRSAIRLVVWSCGLVDVAVCGPVRAVCGPVETRPAPYSIQWPAGFKCLDIGRASGLSLAGIAVVLR